jgi:CubicO group peptidase (beta-lactamase class C family)
MPPLPQISSAGDIAWGGAANTGFWIDKEQQMIVIYMTQVLQQNRVKNPIRTLLGNLACGSIMTEGPQTLQQATSRKSRL